MKFRKFFQLNTKKRKILWDYFFLSPQLIIYLLLTIIPFFVAIPMLFTDQATFLDTNINNVGFENFSKVFNDPLTQQTFWPALSRTAQFTLVHFVMAYLFGLGLALLMYEIGFKGGMFTIIYLPYMLSGLALGFMAVMLFSQSTGTFNLALMELGLLDTPIDIKLEQGTTIILPILVGWRSAVFTWPFLSDCYPSQQRPLKPLLWTVPIIYSASGISTSLKCKGHSLLLLHL